MNYAKLIDGEIMFAPRKIQTKINGVSYTVYNPSAQMLIADGWLPVVFTEPPSDPTEGHHYEPTYTEENNEIVQGWELVETEYDGAEVYDILFGGDEP